MNFFDTSAFVPAFLRWHPAHSQCARRIANLNKNNAACGMHTLNELYSTVTRLPRSQRIAPADASAICRTVAARVKCISLTLEETLVVLEDASKRGLSGPIVYDALLMACARKSAANHIYTLNVRHFKLVAPDLESRILEP